MQRFLRKTYHAVDHESNDEVFNMNDDERNKRARPYNAQLISTLKVISRKGKIVTVPYQLGRYLLKALYPDFGDSVTGDPCRSATKINVSLTLPRAGPVTKLQQFAVPRVGRAVAARAAGRGVLKHEKITGAVDHVPATFVRTFAICLMIGVAFWAAILAIVV